MFHRACCIYYNNAPASPRAPPRRAYYPGSAGVRARRWALAGVQLARASLPLVEAESENRVEVQLPSSALAQSASAVAAQAKTKTPVLTSGWAVKEPLFLLSTLLYIHKVCAVFWRVFFEVTTTPFEGLIVQHTYLNYIKCACLTKIAKSVWKNKTIPGIFYTDDIFLWVSHLCYYFTT